MKKFRKFIKKVKSKTIGEIKKRSLKCLDFSIISNNCWGGIIYQEYNLPYNSPTVGLYFFAEDYILFLENLSFYLNKELRFINYTESKHYDDLKNRNYNYENAIIGVIDDVEIIFLHYNSEEEAKEKRDRRKERINFDKLIIKFNDQNGFKEEYYERFKKLPYKHKLFFTCNPHYTDSFCVYFKKYNGFSSILEDVTSYKRYVDMKEKINEL